jgi:DNA replication protein DnaC
MAYLKQEEIARVRSRMRSMFFSNDTIDAFLAGATAGQISAVDGMIAHELEVRERRKRARLLRRARIPQVKSFDGYDFSQVAFPDGYCADDLMGLSFVDAAQDFVFYGQTGRGKTHLASAIALACVNLGKEVRFYTAAELVMVLTRAKAESRLERALGDIARAELLVVDELGYVPLDREGARLLFQAMGDCYERRSLVITTNIEFSKWGVVFGDDKMASALIDRIMHHGRLVEFGGPSKRMEHALMLGKSDS